MILGLMQYMQLEIRENTEVMSWTEWDQIIFGH